MKILYSVQATGNGHISRAMELYPILSNYGEVDIFLSGSNSSLSFSYPIKYRSKGISLFYSCIGSINFEKTITSLTPLRVLKEMKELPVEKYDLVLNDFECITSLACSYKKIPSINFGHQASFYSPLTPRPKKKSKIGEWILKNYARGTFNIGLHFDRYDDFILPPVIKKDICNAEVSDDGSIVIYLPSYCDHILRKCFSKLSDHIFHIFSHQAKQIVKEKNLIFHPVERDIFNRALINCKGIITGAGFETPAEVLRLGKKLMVMPIRGQYEQYCNAAALEKIGIMRIDDLEEDIKHQFEPWLNSNPKKFLITMSNEDIVSQVMKLSIDFLADLSISESMRQKPGSILD